MRRKIRAGICGALFALAAPMHAQCPDGTPPPCNRPRPAPVRPMVPMDQRTWIVLPFENLARALGVIRRMTDTTLLFTPLGAPVSDATLAFTGALWPRAYLLRAELEEAKGDREKAREYYRRFAQLWVGADAEFAAMVARAKQRGA